MKGSLKHGVGDLLRASARPRICGSRSCGLLAHLYTPSRAQSERVRFYTPSYTLRKKLNGDVPGAAVELQEAKAAKLMRKNTSLRQVAVEAARSRAGIVRGPSKRKVAEREADTKQITAYCAAEQYSIAKVARILRDEGYEIDPFHTNLYPQVVHVQVPLAASHPEQSSSEQEGSFGDIFVFPSGTLVAWNVPDSTSLRLVNKVLAPAANNPHDVETEDLEYVEQPASSKSKIMGDTIVLGTNSRSNNGENADVNGGDPETNTALAKIAFSSGLSRSAKLSVLENLFENYFQSTKSIPSVLMKGSSLPYDRPFILSKTGELLNIRAQLNLYNELTDSLPDLLWESESSLGLEDYFDKVGRALDISVRIDTLNDRMDYATEIATVLRERLSEKHGWTLEWYIIALIAVELVFEGVRFYNESREREKEDELRALLSRVLQLQEKGGR